ncbi:amino acid adenylation domain-containing protein [Dactylosporangium vinaceum]|uniref:Amino acid adenylation domain-containing protein n=1 Tax=Dactylosporangium vinaceum TaxID=53362 RepID=A0ABV5M3S2_9ACTN|nr:non-ribosomal peptide synthetase/MFS transporter [Dactylosporangium vinaceum]UAB94479.1 amino acid adenylation domain-containing protein [Dactylosporangium vinaceum]
MTAAPSQSNLSPVKRALLEQRLRASAATAVIPRRPAGSGDPPLSFGQERLWFMEQFAPGSAAYSLPFLVRLRGELDHAALTAAVNGIAARHEPLRSRFPAGDDGKPHVVVDAWTPLEVPVVDAEGEAAAERLVTEAIAVPFDLATGPLLRPLLVRIGPADHVLLILIHHIATDGWSMDLVHNEFVAGYDAAVEGRAPALPALPVGYYDYAAWQHGHLSGAALDRDVAHWRAALAGLEPLDLPTDRPRPARQTYSGANRGMGLDAGLTAGLKRLARARGATLSMALLACWQAVLARHSGQRDFAVGTPVAGRPHPEVEGLVGMFVNTLALRARLDGDPTFNELLARTRETSLDAYAHQDIPFERLVTELKVHRDVARPPLFQVLHVVQNYAAPGRPRPGRLTPEPFRVPLPASRFDLELYWAESGDGLGGVLTYNPDLFAAATIDRLAEHLEAFVAAVVADPDRRLSTVEPAPGVCNAPEAVDVPDATLAGLLAAQVHRTPDAPAVTFEGRSWTYAELDTAAGRVAGRLRRLGVGPGSLVAVCAERSHELVAALLGVLKAGAAYVPLDPEYPADRLAFMLTDAAAPVVLTQGHLSAVLPETAAAVVLLESIDDDPAGADATPDDLAYVIYTSGSTGRPKGVGNTHRGIVNRLDWMQRQYGLDATDAVLQKTPASFDVSVWEFFWPLLTGARLVLARPGGHRDAAYLRDLIDTEQITTAHFVPSMLAVFLAEAGEGACPSLRRIICSGEALPPDVAARCLERLPARLWNLYGPTEAAVDVSAFECTPAALDGAARVPIGAPIQNIALYVLDEHLRPAPVGVAGQLYIAGVGLARGYLRRPGLTAERFLPDPFGPPGSRMYATGDRARWRADGTAEFLGRIDGQVKLRGLRIELGEIEAALREQPGVTEAAAVVREDQPGDQRIVAYAAGPADLAAARAALKRRLPDYMVPVAVVAVDALPLSPSGKLDRRALPAPQIVRDESTALVAPRTPAERFLADVWRDLLKLDALGIDDDFFDLGGHSMLATQLVARLRKEFGAGVAVLDVFQHPTIRDLAALVSTPAAERGPRRLVNELTRPVPAQRRTLSFVCVPYGGGSAVVYQPLADALPDGCSLYAVSVPGQDIGLDEPAIPLGELVDRCTAEILASVEGPLVLYGHCAIGSAVAVALARALEAAGRELEAVYVGGIFPFARPSGRVLSRVSRLLARREKLRGNRSYENWLRSMGVEMGEFDAEQANRIVANMRAGSDQAEDYYTELFDRAVTPLKTPIISVAGDRDPTTEWAAERYREWLFLTSSVALVELQEAGHFFLKYRARELATIITTVHRTAEPVHDPGGGWAVTGRADRSAPARPAVQPTMRRFLAVAAGQQVSIIGTALTEFALPLWIYLSTGSLPTFALLAVLGLVPGILIAPVAGALVDRYDRRRVILAGDIAAGCTQAVMLGLAVTGRLGIGAVFGLIVVLSIALAFQRLAYFSAVPQLVPKRYLGHANGVVQLAVGVAQFLVPLLAAGLFAAIGLRGILLIDVVSYAVAVGVLLAVRFPDTMPWHRRESLIAEIVGGWRYSTGKGGFGALLGFFAVLNIFLSPLFLLVSPLVLSFGTLSTVARVSVCAGLGAIVGALVMGFWGGPRHRRVRGMLLCVLVLATACVLTALHPVEAVVAAGAFGMSFGLTVVNGIYTTIVQVKVPQRFHGRVFALNTLLAWSTIPLAWGVVVPFGSRLFEPLLRPDGPLAGTVGAVIGVGPGRGTALMYVVCAAAMGLIVLAAFRIRAIARFDDRVPDALPDDLIGARTARPDTAP